jgi:siderophore-iron reductase FhuF
MPVGTDVPTAIRQAVYAELARIGRRRFLQLEIPDGAEVVPSTRFLDGDYLRGAFIRAGSFGNCSHDANLDLRAAASRWTRMYASSLVNAVLAGMILGIGIDASLERTAMLMKSDAPGSLVLADPSQDAVACDARPSSVDATEFSRVSTVDELRAYVLERLFTHNLTRVFDAVHALVKLSPKVVWSNVAESIDLFYDSGLEQGETETYLSDRRAIIMNASLAGVGPNPLHGLLRWEKVDASDLPLPLQIRNHCCIVYLLPDRPVTYCRNCPLIPLDEIVSGTRAYRARIASREAS